MEWRSINDAPDYEVSDCGHVRRTVDSRRAPAGSVLKPRKDRGGYISYVLSTPSGKRSMLAHRLVAKAFLGDPPESKSDINHMDGVKSNNQVGNLEWCDRSHNVRHAISTGLKQPLRGESNPSSIVDESVVREIRRRFDSGESVMDIQADYPVTYAAVWRIARRLNWRHVA